MTTITTIKRKKRIKKQSSHITAYKNAFREENGFHSSVVGTPLPATLCRAITSTIKYSARRKFMEEMNQTEHITKQTGKQNTEQSTPAFSMRMDNTTYLVQIRYKESGKETLEDKIKRLMLDEVKNGDFY